MNQPQQPLPALRTDLAYTVHQKQAGLWYAVQDPHSGKFLKLGRKEYLLACALDGRRTLSEVLATLVSIDPALQATEDDVKQLTTWLMKAGMLQIEGQTPAEPSHHKLLLNPLYTRVPLVRGEHLERVARWVAPLVTGPLVVVVLLLYLAAAAGVLFNWEEFTSRASNLFVADGRLWWLVAWLVLKSAHELGHAVAAVKVGSQIRAAGISFIFLAPVPYVDISDLWTISNRWHRILCSAGGMLVELALAAVAAIVALQTSNESLQYFCCAVATMGTVTTLAFNANPLIRFDGYFIVSDLLNRPNLWTEGQQAVKQLVSRIWRPTQTKPPRIRLGYVVYGLACYQYRIVMLLTLAVWSILVWQGLGVAFVAWGIYAMIISPWRKSRSAAKQQAAASAEVSPARADGSPEASTTRGNWGWCVAASLMLLLLLAPSPVQPSAPGLVVLREPVTLRAETEGFLEQVLVNRGQTVQPGELLARLVNPQLELEMAMKQNDVSSMQERIQAKRARGELAELQSDEAQLVSLQTQLKQLQEKSAKLEVRATAAGTLVSHDLHRQVGKFFPCGEPMGLIAEPAAIEVSVSASQQDAERIRASIGQPIHISLAGGMATRGVVEEVEMRGSNVLQEPLLAAIYDGPLTVELERDDNGGEVLRLPTPRFAVRIRLDDGDRPLPPGQMAWIPIPGKSANLWDVVARWLEKKWTTIEQQSAQSSG